MIADIVEETGKVLVRIIVETIFFFTGEIALFVVTLGQRKPRWDFYTNESPAKYAVFSEISTWIGGAIWIFGVGFIARSFV